MNSENQHIEWKEIWKEEFMRNIVAFANSEGGTLFIGISDKGQVVGLQNAELLL